MNEVVKFEAPSMVTTVNSRSGATTNRLQSAGEFAKAYKALHPDTKRKEINRRYDEYLRENSKLNTAGLAALLTTGKVGVTGVTLSKDQSKGAIKVIFLDKMAEQTAADAAKSIETITDENALRNLLKQIQEKLPVEVPQTEQPAS